MILIDLKFEQKLKDAWSRGCSAACSRGELCGARGEREPETVCGSSRGDSGAEVRAPLRRSPQRFPSHTPTHNRASEPELPVIRSHAELQEVQHAGESVKSFTLGVQVARTHRNTSLKKINAPFANVSFSEFRLRHEPSRYPRYIPEAYCLCKGCLTGPSGEESEDYRSVPVFVPTAVLRRSGSCVGGRRSYTESYESIAVGCTCVPALQAHKSAHRNNQSTRTAVQNSNTRRKGTNWTTGALLN